MSIDVKSEVVTVTPDLAAQWLTYNTHNRPLRPRTAEAYARDMKGGNWQFNGEAIKFAEDDKLLDGQHRLQGVVMADVPVSMLVVWGLPNEAQETVDGGIKRKFADVLALRGEKDVNVLASTCRLAHFYGKGQIAGMAGSNTVTNAELSAALDAHPDLRVASRVGDQVSKRCSLPPSLCAFTYWLFSRIDDEDAEFFVKRLGEDTGWERGDPIYELRRLAEASNDVRGTRDRVFLMAVTIKAWNAYRNGNQVLQLKWRRGGAKPESFPEPI